jgi:hypothetical protein
LLHAAMPLNGAGRPHRNYPSSCDLTSLTIDRFTAVRAVQSVYFCTHFPSICLAH